ncbi:MAG: 4Fe-4S binding protein [candidate division Zixibacteria bacterium]|nr:4Fe-4S binding protein [candidate division Zixibacteria bacterium]
MAIISEKSEKQKAGQYKLPLEVFLFTFSILALVQLKLTYHPIILLERFISGGGWFEITVIAFYGAFVAYKMQIPLNVPKWRRITWTIFSFVFFSQLIIGLLGVDKFLMTGKLHLPIPMMILAGPLYRGHLSMMTILFLSTIVLTGSAWCSQLCYFGAFDNIASIRKTERGVFKNKKAIKTTLILVVIAGTLLLRWFNVPILIATLIAVGFGLIGIVVIICYSRKKRKMVHCILYCPIGTVVNMLKPVNPFRLDIDNSCNLCMKCTSFCKYDALNIQDVRNKKPNFSCTLCGDCLAACRDNSIKYRYFNLKPEKARNLYLILTISLHAVFLALARI